ncbi:unnamed protein product, partial [Laminaria digitata]
LLLSLSSVCHGLIETCEDLQAAFELTKTQDVVEQIDPWQRIECLNFTTMSMDSNSLTVEPTEILTNVFPHVDLSEVRFEVTNGAKLFWQPVVEFRGSETQDVNGGGVFVGEGSTVRFYDSLDMTDVGVRSVPEEGSDFATYQLSGGCVYADGYFRVDGKATFERCEVGGGGESSPGPGGVVYVGEQGSVLFNGGVKMSEVSIIDDEGNNGGGIYNKGKVNIKGDSVFDDLNAEAGGAIFNAVGAQMNFRNGATALFTDCFAFDGIAGALYNQGSFKFSGPALFVNTDSPSIFVSSTGRTVFSEQSAFWANEDNAFGIDTTNPAVLVSAGGEVDVPSSVIFYGEDESECRTVFFEEDETCL